MKRSQISRLAAFLLPFSLLLSPTAQALTVEQTAQLIQELYVDEVPDSVLDQPTIQGIIDALGDPYTEYFTAQEYADFVASMSDDSLVGIGIRFSQTEDGLLLSEVIEGSPALKGGLLAGDIITAVDGQSVLDQDTDTITSWIQGEAGTTVAITYLRQGRHKTVTLTRALVVVAATTTELIDDHIGYIRCSTFGEETLAHFRAGLEKYQNDATVWIVDLRYNLGGVTEAATSAAGLFTGRGEMAYLRDSAGEYGAYYCFDDSVTLYPVIVLMNGQSASASEIFASAIRDNGAGIVVGDRSFGKGVAQTILDQTYLPEYFPDGDALKITSHRFFTSGGNTTDQVGVIPDLLVDPEIAADVAYLLAGPDPMSDTSGTLRIDLSWRWFVDLDTAQKYPEIFQALLDAIPDNKSLWLGTGGPTGWQQVEISEIADQYGLEYHTPFFPDQDDSKFYAPLSILKTYDLVHGREDGLFYPGDPLTRAELCQLLAIALNCSVPTNQSPFDDVSEDAWYAPAVTAMSNMGLVTGTGDNLFCPEDPIDHQQFITIMGRLAQRLNMYLYDTVQNMPENSLNIVGLMNYADWAKSSAWLLSYSQKGYFGNTISLLWDSADQIDPTEYTSRDEAAYVLYRLLSYTDILPA